MFISTIIFNRNSRYTLEKFKYAKIFLFAFFARMIMFLLLNYIPSAIPCLESFALENHIIDGYDVIARNLVTGNGFSYNSKDPTCCRAPLYPMFLSFIIMILPNAKNVVLYFVFRIIHIIFDSINALLIYWVSSKWFGSNRKKLIEYSAYIYAFNPVIIYYTIQMGSELVANFCFLFFLRFFTEVFKSQKNNFWRSLLLGISGGMLILNRSIFLALMLLIVPLIWLIYHNISYVKRYALSLIISFILMAPWIFRNYLVSGHFVPVQTLTGFNFWYDFLIDANRNKTIFSGNLLRTFSGQPVILSNGVEYRPYALDSKTDALYDRELILKGLDWIFENPLKFLGKIIDNIFSFWYFSESPLKMIISGLFSLIIILLSVRGSLKLLKIGLDRETLFLICIVLLMNIIYSPVFAVFRYSLTTYPILSLLAAGNFVPINNFKHTIDS